jgi:glycosyltransferase involved in cell wall biosynthesis
MSVSGVDRTGRVVLVDWLGRGGIAQTSEAWALELGARGHMVDVVTRAHRELGAGVIAVRGAPPARGKLGAHRAVARAAATRIRETSPTWVVVQNYVVPYLERPVYRAARDCGAHVAVVVHDHRLHSRLAGTDAGLVANLRRADVLVAHSDFVAEHVAARTGRDVQVLPHPVPVGLLSHPRVVPAPLDAPGASDLWCAHFGVVKRRYKGTELVEALAAEGVDGWRFAVLGTDRPADRRVFRLTGFVDPGTLVGAVGATDVTLAPYRLATQSGVVVLAHALGSVPVATRVGGLPEQVHDGVDGVLVDPDAGVGEWRAVLDDLRDDDHRKALAAAGEERVWAEHAEFASRIAQLVR